MNYSNLIRSFSSAVALTLMMGAMVGHASAQQKANQQKTEGGGAVLIEMYDSWGAYATRSNTRKVCYAMSKPIDRKPDSLRRDPGYVFVSSRPSEKIWDELVFVVGFPIKKDSDVTIQINNETFQLLSDGSNVWAKSSDDQARLLSAMKKGATMSVTAFSQRGNKSTDSYSLKGISKALDRTRQACR